MLDRPTGASAVDCKHRLPSTPTLLWKHVLPLPLLKAVYKDELIAMQSYLFLPYTNQLLIRLNIACKVCKRLKYTQNED